MKFIKMHGAGNDYVYIDLFTEVCDNPQELAPLISDRNFGVGGDGLILIAPSSIADAKMRMFNNDGSEAEMCGNGIRCIAKFVIDSGIVSGPEIKIETMKKVLQLTTYKNKVGKVDSVKVNMGKPVFNCEDVPCKGFDSAVALDANIKVDDIDFNVSVVSMGNPHCVIFVDDLDNYPVYKYGSMIESSKYFPNRVNVEFVEIISKNEIKIRTWERGSGETLACGTGASAVCAVMSQLHNFTGEILAHLRGGDLKLEWIDRQDIFMTGPATEVFRGVYNPT